MKMKTKIQQKLMNKNNKRKNDKRLKTTQRKIQRIYKTNGEILEDLILDVLSIHLLFKKIDKIVDKMYLNLKKIIFDELYENIFENYRLLYDIIDVDKTLDKDKINAIITNPNTEHSINFELEKNKRRLKSKIHSEIEAKKNDMTYQELANEIKTMVYRKSYGQVKGDCYKTLRIYITEHTRIRTQAKLEACKELKKQGYNVSRRWLYTYEAKEPRQAHLHSNGLAENYNGYFIINGYRTRGPGLFGVASEDINCRCDTECYVETARF